MLQIEPEQGGQAACLADCLHDLRWQEVVASPGLRELSGHETGTTDESETDGCNDTSFHEAQNRRNDWRDQKLRQGDPYQYIPDLDRAIVLNRGQELRDDVRRRK